MKLITTFFGDDLLFEGDMALALRALPAGARVTRAVATLAPAASTRPRAELFSEEFAVDDAGGGPFGLLVEREATTPAAAVVDLGARRTVQRLGVTGLAAGASGGAFVQLDMGGIWAAVDNQGVPTTSTAADRRRYVAAAPSPNPQNLPPALALPGLAGQRLRIHHAAPSQTAEIAVRSVTLRSYPSNVVLRLGDLGPVWFKIGDLRQPVTTLDFAAMLDAFTQRTEPQGGVYEVPFLLHSDTLARLRVTLELEYYLSQPLLPPPLTQAVFAFGYSAVPESAPATLTANLPLNARALPGATAAQVSGRFAESRVVHGPVRRVNYADTVPVTLGQTVAHPIRLGAPATVDAIDLDIEATTSAMTLLVTLQEDVGGKPWGVSLFAEPVRVELARPAAGGAQWASAPLAAPFTFQADAVYWLVATAAEGEGRWAVQPAGDLPPLQRTTDGGLSYRQVTSEALGGPVAGIYRLRSTPAGFRQPIKLDVAGHEVDLSRFDALGKVDFRLDLPEVAAAVNAALADAANAQEPLSERVVNGDFARWTRHERRARRNAAPPLALGVTLGAPAPHAAAGLAVSPDASRIFVAGRNFQAPEAPVANGVIRSVVNGEALHFGEDRPLGPTSTFAIDPVALACSPGGEYLYAMINRRDRDGLTLDRYAASRDEPPASRQLVRLREEEPVLLAADPACRFVYLATRRGGFEGGSLALLARISADLTTFDEDDVVELAGSSEQVNALLVAPDGRRAYLAVDGAIAAVDLEGWRSLGSAWGPTPGASLGASFGRESAGRLLGLALSPDGARLYAVQEPRRFDNEYRRARELVVIDAARFEEAAAGRIPFAQAVLAVAPLMETGMPTDATWLPIAATPDDTRIVVAADDLQGSPSGEGVSLTWRLYLVDADGYRVLETFTLGNEAVALATTPDSRRALVLTVQDAPSAGPELRTIELDSWSADEWALTAGRVAPVCAPGSEKPALRLGAPDSDTGLSQIVAVRGGQQYELRFLGRASEPGAAAEIFWLSAACGRLGEATIPIDDRCAAGLWPHRLRATAPEGADRAELRLKQPFGGFAIVDDVSLAAPGAATANGDFAARVPAMRPDDPRTPLTDAQGTAVLVPSGWSLAPADLPAGGMLQYQADGAVRLAPIDARPATLSQQLAIAAGKPVVLEIQATPFGPPAAEPATVELRWVGSAALPLRAEIDARQFDVITARGDAPPDATGAELVIAQPPGGALTLRRVQVSQPASVEIPLTFLAETPGDLSVVDPVVGFDLGEAPHPGPAGTPQPREPLGCAPTPPEDVPLPPGGEPRPGDDLLEEPELAEGHCPCCERLHVLAEPEVFTSACGMRGVAGTCRATGARSVIYPARRHAH